jgi:hypothetical protein
MSADVAQEISLRWRVPTCRAEVGLRFSLVRIGFAAVIVGMMILLLTPAESQSALFAATIVLALLAVVVQWLRASREASGESNVWLDHEGLHWRDGQSRQQTLPRVLAQSFLIGIDEETQQQRPALTLLLADGFVSQPIELHAPADEAQVRQWLREHWSLPESTVLPVETERAIDLESDLDLQRQSWRFTGSRAGIEQLAAALDEAARLALPPIGARPKQMVLLFRSVPVGLAVSPHTWIDADLLAATPGVLTELSSKLREQLASVPSTGTFETELVADTGHHWQLKFTLEPAAV